MRRPSPPRARIASALVAIVVAASACAAGCNRGSASHPDVKKAASSTSSIGAPGGGPRLRRLSAREYIAVVHDLIGEDVAPVRLVEDSLPTGYDNGDATLGVQGDQALLYAQLAADLANRAVTSHLDRLLAGCDPSRDANACRRVFYEGFALRALRRPLRDAERARLDALFDAGVADGGFTRGLAVVVETLLQWPSFLYREELGADLGAAPGAPTTLTSYELASELSFFLTGTMPDDALLAAAASGRLTSPADVRREAMRLLDTPRADAVLRVFAHAWLGTSYVAQVVKDPQVFPGFDAALAASMRADLDATYDASFRGTLTDLFSTRAASVDARLAALYGVAPDPGNARRSIDLDGTRAGVLTRAGYLAVHASVDGSNPVARGVFLRATVLCAPLPPPPAGAAAKTDFGSDPHTTTRQKYAQHSSDPACQTCHSAIDGIGFGFESFDGVGAYRTSENGEPIDASGEIFELEPGGPFVGVPDLEARILEGPDLPSCFVRQVFRDAMGRAEGPSDAKTLEDLGARFDVHTKIRDLFLDMATSRAFSERVGETP